MGHLKTYLFLELKELWYVIEDRGESRAQQKELFAREMSQWMHNGEVSFDRDRHCDKDGTDSADVTDAETHRQNVVVDGIVI